MNYDNEIFGHLRKMKYMERNPYRNDETRSINKTL
jgi:hypothetical protein